ncbi:hypothetical protein BJY01DRAFT_6462 [Aspergillus pseudoustus]|uniref:BRCT domain-containing protein n=1 Tax=Aspergillus pseudoustus TaxID=1810923 RepID=A0ABR4JPC3_9EURO
MLFLLQVNAPEVQVISIDWLFRVFAQQQRWNIFSLRLSGFSPQTSFAASSRYGWDPKEGEHRKLELKKLCRTWVNVETVLGNRGADPAKPGALHDSSMAGDSRLFTPHTSWLLRAQEACMQPSTSITPCLTNSRCRSTQPVKQKLDFSQTDKDKKKLERGSSVAIGRRADPLSALRIQTKAASSATRSLKATGSFQALGLRWSDLRDALPT